MFRGFVFALPVSLVLWAVIIAAIFLVAEFL